MSEEPTPYDELRRIAGEMIEDLRSSGAVPGIEIGEIAPDFTLPDSVGRSVRLANRLAIGPVVVVFYRGSWCPYCDTHLRGLNQVLDEISGRGASLVAISPQAPDDSLDFAGRLELGFDVLSDVDQVVSKQWHLRFPLPERLRDAYLGMGMDLGDANADGSWNLPVPATFVIDRDGVVRARHVDPDYRERMDPTAVVAALEQVVSR